MLPNDMILILAPFPGNQKIASNRLAGNTAKSWYSAGGLCIGTGSTYSKASLGRADRLKHLDFRRRNKNSSPIRNQK
jgi:hypothetical protein